MNITELEKKMLNNIANSCYGEFDINDPDHKDSQTWLFEACDNNNNFTPAEKGVLSSLIKKELVKVCGYDKFTNESTIEFTEAGVEALKANQ